MNKITLALLHAPLTALHNRRAPFRALLLALLIPLSGCETLENIVQSTPHPEATIRGARLANLSLDDAALAFDVDVSNPYSVGLPLTDLAYSIASDGMTFLTGAVPMDGTIPARSTRTVTLPATIRFQDMLGILNSVRPGQVIPYDADLTLTANAPAIGPVALPVSRHGELPIPNVPNVAIEGMEWSTLTLDSARAIVKLRVENTNGFPIDLNTLHYGLSLGGTNVAETTVTESMKLGSQKSGVLEIPIAFAPRNLGMAVFQMITGSGSSYDVGGRMAVTTPFGPLDLPFQQSGETPFIR